MPGSQNKIKQFIKELSVQRLSPSACNIYSGKSKASVIRRNNLRIYLNKMQELNPRILLIGEAPGYKGCRLTGIPFTSERIIQENEFFRDIGLRRIKSMQKVQSESSASIVWEMLDNYPNKPLIWNIFPFHPHTNGEPESNRTPNQQELEMGSKFLQDLLGIYSVEHIITLGRKAEYKTRQLGYDCVYVRHPSRGGKQLFLSGIAAEL